MARIVWLFSLARSGSSVSVYAAAAPFGHAVADEVMGPWDRTGEPYHYPKLQAELVRAYQAAERRLTPEVVQLAHEVHDQIAERTGSDVVISKWPHLRPEPSEWRRAFPESPAVYLIRNPLHRLNSFYRRGWLDSSGPNFDLARFTQFARWWVEQSNRVSYDDLKRDPAAFFRRVWAAWGFAHDEGHVDQALSYMRSHYHDSSLKLSDRSTDAVMSESGWALPAEAVRAYLDDPFVGPFMQEQGWSVDPADYGA